MSKRPIFGIRTQVVLLTVVPLVFIVLSLFLLLMLVRANQRSALVEQRVTSVVTLTDRMTKTIGSMSAGLGKFYKSHKASDLKPYDAAQSVIAAQQLQLLDLVHGTPALDVAGKRFVKDNRLIVAFLGVIAQRLRTGRFNDVPKILTAPSTKALGNEAENARSALSGVCAQIIVAINAANARFIDGAEKLLLLTAALGIFCTVLFAVLFGLRLVRRLGTLGDNARRMSIGESPTALGGDDEVTQLDGVYRAMFQQVADLRENERSAKVRLERAVLAYGQLAAEIASGDLTARVIVDDPSDELGELGTNLNAMAESLAQLIEQIQGAASSLATATTEILAATNQQVASATEGATAVRQTAVSVLEVRQTSEAAANRTRTVAELAQRVHQTAEDGRRSVEASVRATVEAKERMEVLAERILAFSDQAQAIAEINATVATLAEQSNLLAVNAGIEAAKAGEAGRGFSVVAGEVKELGARSKEATVQVRRIVAEIQRSAQSAVLAAEQGMKVAESGTVVAQRSGEAMAVLAASIAEASAAALQINASAEQQQVGMDQIALAMQSIEQATVQSVAATKQVERAATDLSELAQQLTETIADHVRVGDANELDLIS